MPTFDKQLLSSQLPPWPKGFYRTNIMESMSKAPHIQLKRLTYDPQSNSPEEDRFTAVTVGRDEWFPQFENYKIVHEGKGSYAVAISRGAEWFELWQKLEVAMPVVGSSNFREYLSGILLRQHHEVWQSITTWFEGITAKPSLANAFLPTHFRDYAMDWARCFLMRNVAQMLLKTQMSPHVKKFVEDLQEANLVLQWYFQDFDKTKDANKAFISAVFEKWGSQLEKSGPQSLRDICSEFFDLRKRTSQQPQLSIESTS